VQKKYDKACADFAEAIRSKPKDARARICRAVVWATEREFSKAIDDLNEAVRLEPNNADAYARRGECWLYCSSFDQAIADFDRAISLDPTDERSVALRRVCREAALAESLTGNSSRTSKTDDFHSDDPNKPVAEFHFDSPIRTALGLTTRPSGDTTEKNSKPHGNDPRQTP
jgi:tetratricopeptide (TPR) repeat protein